jgi:hypothetical protein
MHSWHIAFWDLVQSFEPYSFKECCFKCLFPNFRYKRLSERKYFINKPHCYGAISYSSSSKFLLKTK